MELLSEESLTRIIIKVSCSLFIAPKFSSVFDERVLASVTALLLPFHSSPLARTCSFSTEFCCPQFLSDCLSSATKFAGRDFSVLFVRRWLTLQLFHGFICCMERKFWFGQLQFLLW